MDNEPATLGFWFELVLEHDPDATVTFQDVTIPVSRWKEGLDQFPSFLDRSVEQNGAYARIRLLFDNVADDDHLVTIRYVNPTAPIA